MSIGFILTEVLSGKLLFPGKNVVHQLDLMTDLLGTPFTQKFGVTDHLSLKIFEILLAFDSKDRPTRKEDLEKKVCGRINEAVRGWSK